MEPPFATTAQFISSEVQDSAVDGSTQVGPDSYSFSMISMIQGLPAGEASRRLLQCNCSKCGLCDTCFF